MNELVTTRMTIDEAVAWKSKVGGTANQLRILLFEGYERCAWESLGYTNWTECVKALAEEYGFTERRLWQLHAANQTEKLLNNCSVGEVAESVLRPLTSLPEEDQPIVYQRAVETAPDGKVTAAHVQSVVDEYKQPKEYEVNHNQHVDELSYEESYSYDDVNDEESTEAEPAQQSRPHVSFNSGNNEWYTPSEYIDAARSVMGCIDLDPASSPEANKVVNADNFYTAADNGLQYQWLGKVWMNPPYASGLVNQFAKKMAEHVSCGDVTDAIVLVNNATETEWFRQLIGVSSCVCFPQSRVKFWKPNGDTGAPLQGQAIIYIGNGRDSFLKEFSKFGWCSIVTNV